MHQQRSSLIVLLLLLPLPLWALDKPANLICAPIGVSTDQVRIAWTDTSDDETAYRVERRENSGDWNQIADIAADSQRHDDTGLSNDTVYRYRVRAYRGGDDSFGPYSDVCRPPQALDTANFRIYHRPYPIADCPDRDGRPMCVPTTTNGEGDNEMAARIGGLMEDSRTALIDLGFNDLAFYDNSPPLPVDLTWCDGGGCAGTTGFGNGRVGGIGLAPEYMGNYDPVTMAGDPSSVLITLHEAFHQQQYTYGGLQGDPNGTWVWEGQARSIQDKVCIGPSSSNCISLDQVTNGVANYIGEVNGYLSNVNRSIPEISYRTALFWTYMTEHYGTLSAEPGLGMDLMRVFWEQGADDINDDGIGTLDRALDALGHSERFVDAIKDFMVANYAKDLSGPGVPTRYQYTDETQAAGAYDPVDLDLDQALGLGDQVGPTLDEVVAWGARYYQIRPSPDVPIITAEFRQDTANQVYYTLLAVKGNDIALEINHTGEDFVETFPNDDYDQVVVIVAGLANFANFRYAFNATQPALNILDPIQGRPAIAGDPTTPEKFLIKLEVLTPLGGGTPLEGIDTTDFELSVGGVVVPENQIISSAFLQGQYWLLIRAPGQTSGGLKALSVDWQGALSATELDAVDYSPQADADNLLTIDRSGSMADFNKLDAAQQAARLYVDSWRDGDGIGVVSYANSGRVDLSLRNWNTTSRDGARTEINNLSASGATAIGDGLADSLQQLIDNGDEMREWAIILLSDGIETATPDIADFLDTYNGRDDAGDKVPRVHTVALGPDADRVKLENLARETGGTYHYAAEPTGARGIGDPDDVLRELAEIYRVISETVSRQQQVYSERDSISYPNPASHIITVDGTAREAVFVLKWDANLGLNYNTTLLDPMDNDAGPPTLSDSGHRVWRINTPMSGDWTLRLDPVIIGRAPVAPTQTGVPYLVEASVRADLTLELFLGLAPAERQTGRRMPVLVNLADSAPVTGASVVATIVDPVGTPRSLSLRDDGLHGDGAANDGFYGNLYTATAEPGSYVLVVEAAGTGVVAGDFTRRLRGAFNLSASPDEDLDGLPTWWEETFGTDPDNPDGGEDPDQDDSTNSEEFERGTHPLDPDSDDGGENDGSESGDPLDPSDDAIAQPRTYAWADVGQVRVRFTTEANYSGVRIWRALDEAGPFSPVAVNAPANGEYLDTSVSNGTRYCYRVAGLSAGGAVSAPSNISCATPNTDPLAPTGWVRINGGAPATHTTAANLDLFASDNPAEPEGDHPGVPQHPEALSRSGVSEMRISNAGDFEGASWEPYQPTRPWTLEPRNGLATVFVQYQDAQGNRSDPYHASIRVLTTGTPPIAQANGPYGGISSEPITLDGNGSSDADGSIVAYEWDINNDGIYEVFSTQPQVDYNFADSDITQVQLRVTDNEGLSGTAIATLGLEDDVDNDGVSTTEEDSGPNGGDGNDDGIPDSQQPEVGTSGDPDQGYVTVVVGGECNELQSLRRLSEAQVAAEFGVNDPIASYPFGLVSFRLSCDSATVTIHFHGSSDLAGLVYRKTIGEDFFDLPGVVYGTTDIAGQTVASATLTLVDNGPADADPSVGVIRDPSGPAQLIATAIPTLGTKTYVLLVVVLLLSAGVWLRRSATRR